MKIIHFMHRIKSNLTFRYLRRVYWFIWTELHSKRMDDLYFLKKYYKKYTGRKLDLANPVRYTEKLQWLKLFYRDPLITRVSDKYELKNYLCEIGHADLAVKTLAIYNSVSEIDFEHLPERFVMKATHGSGWNLICTDKSKLNWKKWKRLFSIWMKQNPHWFGREWNYKDIQPRIIVEEYLEDDSGELRDYKIYCFNGKAHFAQLDEHRFSDHHRLFVDTTGTPIPMFDSLVFSLQKPQFIQYFPKMVEIAEKISKPFPHVRVDFYTSNDKIYIGELTFFDGSGFETFEPDYWDIHWGNVCKLPVLNCNIELYNKINN